MVTAGHSNQCTPRSSGSELAAKKRNLLYVRFQFLEGFNLQIKPSAGNFFSTGMKVLIFLITHTQRFEQTCHYNLHTTNPRCAATSISKTRSCLIFGSLVLRHLTVTGIIIMPVVVLCQVRELPRKPTAYCIECGAATSHDTQDLSTAPITTVIQDSVALFIFILTVTVLQNMCHPSPECKYVGLPVPSTEIDLLGCQLPIKN